MTTIETKDEKKATSWFDTANLGIFIHWGIYSVTAFDDTKSAQRRRVQNGAEWYYTRLKRTYHAGHAEDLTKQYHQQEFKDQDYFELAGQIGMSKIDTDKLCEYFTKKGAKYLVFTAKHHDGYCMWDKANPKNPVAIFAKSCEKFGLKFGIYYSWLEWAPNGSPRKMSQKYVRKVHQHLDELLTLYKPALFWMDGDWSETAATLQSAAFVEKLHKVGVIVNSRLGKDKTVVGDYQNYGDRYISDEKLDQRYESCQTIGMSWGYNKTQTAEHYKSAHELMSMYQKILSSNGNLLLNVALDKDGNIDPFELKVLDSTKFSS